MSNLTRRDPFREMMTLRSAMDRLFDGALSGSTWEWEPFGNELALDVAETEDEFVVKASLPGINPDDLGELAARVGDVGRLVALAAIRLGREIRRVGLDQKTVVR